MINVSISKGTRSKIVDEDGDTYVSVTNDDIIHFGVNGAEKAKISTKGLYSDQPFLVGNTDFVKTAGAISNKYVAPVSGGYNIVAYFPHTYILILDDNNNVKDELLITALNDVVTVNLTAGDKLIGNKPFYLVTSTEARPPINMKLLGTKFATYLNRYDLNIYIYSPFFGGKVRLSDSAGTVYGEWDVEQGRMFKIPSVPDTTDRVYLLESSVPIAVFKQASGNSDTISWLPCYPKFITVRGGTLHVVAIHDNTEIKYYTSDGVQDTIVLNRFDHVTLGRSSQYGGPTYCFVADKPFFAYNEADGDGVDQTPAIPTHLLANYYVLPRDSEYIAFGSKYMFHVDLQLPDGSWYQFEASGSDTTKAWYCKIHADDLMLTKIPKGTIVVTSTPTWAMFEDYISNNETIWFGVKIL